MNGNDRWHDERQSIIDAVLGNIDLIVFSSTAATVYHPVVNGTLIAVNRTMYYSILSSTNNFMYNYEY